MTDAATFGTELRRLRRAAGLSLRKFAERVHYSPSYVSKVETGHARANQSFARLCDTELLTGGTLAAMVPKEAGRRRAAKSAAVAVHALPAGTPQFVGRSHEVAEVLKALRSETQTICVISGMAGVGKSALAVRCAQRLESEFADGCVYLNMRGHTPDASEVTAPEALDRLLRFLGMPDDSVPADPDDRAAFYRSTLRGRSVLLLLDNVRGASQVLPLLPAEPTCRVLVTSRHQLLAVDDAKHVDLRPLAAKDAASLFNALSETDDDADAVNQVVAWCGHLPLAVRIAAVRLRANPVWRISDLRRRLAVEADRMAELDDGTRSVAAVFALSVDALPADQQRAFALLALNPGADIDAHAAAALFGLTLSSADRLLNRLCGAHLVEQPDAGRFQFHDLVRAFAAERVAVLAEPERRAALRRLLELAQHTADRADRHLAPQRFRRELDSVPPQVVRPLADQGDALAWFRAEWPNLVALCRVASQHGYFEHCWQLAFSLRTFFFLAKLWDPWTETQMLALAAAESTKDAWAQAIALNNLGVACIDRGELAQADSYYERALRLFQEVDDPHGVSTALANSGWLAYYEGDFERARTNLSAALTFYRTSGSARNEGITLRGLALVETALGTYDVALVHAREALATFLRLGLDLDAAMSRNCLGWVHYRAGALNEAGIEYAEALSVSERCGSAYEAARAETGLGNAAAAGGDSDEARASWARADLCSVKLSPLMVGEQNARLTLTSSRVGR